MHPLAVDTEEHAPGHPADETEVHAFLYTCQELGLLNREGVKVCAFTEHACIGSLATLSRFFKYSMLIRWLTSWAAFDCFCKPASQACEMAFARAVASCYAYSHVYGV